MKVLFVRRRRTQTNFVDAQAKALERVGVSVDTFDVASGGPFGYLRHATPLRTMLREGQHDVVHAHYGLSGIPVALQRIRPSVVSFLGSDVNLRSNRFISRWVHQFTDYSIFVAPSLAEKLRVKDRFEILQYGVDFDELTPLDKLDCRRQLGIAPDARIVLFCSSPKRPEKNFALAEAAVSRLSGIELMTLGGYPRDELIKLLNAADVVLLTSLSEGSPVVLKEAMACNCPVVSTPVGDVEETLAVVDGCYLASFDPDDVAQKLTQALDNPGTDRLREGVKRFDNHAIALRLRDVYLSLVGD